jgi:hypothetical protein
MPRTRSASFSEVESAHQPNWAQEAFVPTDLEAQLEELLEKDVAQLDAQFIFEDEEEEMVVIPKLIPRRSRSYSSPGLPFPGPEFGKPYKQVSPNTAPLTIKVIEETLQLELEFSSVFEAARQVSYILNIVGHMIQCALNVGWPAQVPDRGEHFYLIYTAERVFPHLDAYQYTGYMGKLFLDTILEVEALMLEVRAAVRDCVSEAEAGELEDLDENHPRRLFVCWLLLARICASVKVSVDLTGLYGFKVVTDSHGPIVVPFRPQPTPTPLPGQILWPLPDVWDAGANAAVANAIHVPGLFSRDVVRLNQVGHQINADADSLCPICSDATCDVQTNCNHRFCMDCLLEWANTTGEGDITCPMDRRRLCPRPPLVEFFRRGRNPGQEPGRFWYQDEVDFWVRRLWQWREGR